MLTDHLELADKGLKSVDTLVRKTDEPLPPGYRPLGADVASERPTESPATASRRIQCLDHPSASAQQVNDQDDQGRHDQEVNQSSADVQAEAQ